MIFIFTSISSRFLLCFRDKFCVVTRTASDASELC